MEGSLARWSKSNSTLNCNDVVFFHLDCGVFECLGELRLTAASLDLSDGADHLTVGVTVDRIESLKKYKLL